MTPRFTQTYAGAARIVASTFGVLVLIVSFAVLLWAALFVQRRHGGLVLLGLSIAILLVSGGVGPTVIGVLAGVAGTSIAGL
ncbi:MAG: hypothetical protein HC828_06905 [Blastochloris sp.]|nr:hypothetical protein [Blastochloris sp.]